MFIRMNDLNARVQRIERVLTNQSLFELARRCIAGRRAHQESEYCRRSAGRQERRAAPCTGTSRSAWPRWKRLAVSVDHLSAQLLGGASEQATYQGMAALRSGNYDKAVATFRK